MLGLKDPIELDEYNYRVCEVLSCDEEATDFYEDDEQTVSVCDRHYKDLDNTRYSW